MSATAVPTVLLVDDEPRILSALQRTLRREGYRLLVAAGPEEALQLLEQERVDAVLSDHKMPRLSGLELLGRVGERWPGAARLLLTGWPEAIPPERVAALGIRAVLSKPWEEAALKAALRDALGPRAALTPSADG